MMEGHTSCDSSLSSQSSVKNPFHGRIKKTDGDSNAKGSIPFLVVDADSMHFFLQDKEQEQEQEKEGIKVEPDHEFSIEETVESVYMDAVLFHSLLPPEDVPKDLKQSSNCSDNQQARCLEDNDSFDPEDLSSTGAIGVTKAYNGAKNVWVWSKDSVCCVGHATFGAVEGVASVVSNVAFGTNLEEIDAFLVSPNHNNGLLQRIDEDVLYPTVDIVAKLIVGTSHEVLRRVPPPLSWLIPGESSSCSSNSKTSETVNESKDIACRTSTLSKNHEENDAPSLYSSVLSSVDSFDSLPTISTANVQGQLIIGTRKSNRTSHGCFDDDDDDCWIPIVENHR